MTAEIYRLDTRSITDERRAQSLIRNATAAYVSTLQDALLLSRLRHNEIGDVLFMLKDLIPSDSGWDLDIDALKRNFR